MMKSNKFKKPPLSAIEKEKKADEFLNFMSTREVTAAPVEAKKIQRVFKKEKVKALALRFPKSLAEDVTEISALTGLSVNAVCVELLRPVVKIKLREIKE